MNDEGLAWFRAAELKHGRVAMAAFVGVCVTGGLGLSFPYSLTLSGMKFADLGTEPIADARANRHADVATDASSDPRTNAVPIDSGMHHCVQLAGGNVRSRSRRQLLRKSSRVRGG